MGEIERIKESSQYLAILLRNRSDFSDWLRPQKNLYRRYPLTGLYSDLRQTTRHVESFNQLAERFREFKQRHFLRIGGRDLLGFADLPETTSQLSDLAVVSLQVGLELLSDHPEWWCGDIDAAAWQEVREDFETIVMGLGKLGGQELNYVSDVDLIFLSAPRSENAKQSYESFVLLNRLCLGLSRLMADRIKGDRVFLVDVRLRPLGKDGQLIPTAEAAAEHYLLRGRAWERQMLLKARPVAGARSSGAAFLQQIRPFIFRRFLDFQAFDELRDMRDRIVAEAVRLALGPRQFDVKLGIGGIREVEFLVQSLQLVYGGRHPELDEPNTLRCLECLRGLKLLSSSVVDELKECYSFLRRVEHGVQLDQNRQTQKIPQSREARIRLAVALGFEGKEEVFNQRLAECCAAVHRHFMELFHSSDGDGVHADELERSGRQPVSSPGSLDLFPEESVRRLQNSLKDFNPSVRETVSGVLGQYAHIQDRGLAEKALLRLDRYFNQAGKRPGLIKVFDSSDAWLESLCKGIAASGMIADLMAHHPGLVEGVSVAGGNCPGSSAWEEASLHVLAGAKGYEEGLEWIRRLKNERTLQVALADLNGVLDYEAVERELSDLADFVIRNTYEHINASLNLAPDVPLAVLALGKLGSREMSYLSDLDLVFVYQPRSGEPEDQVPGSVVGLIQRFMRMVSTPLEDGPGYPVDARLRPTGTFGPLIITQNGWLEYYLKEADLWEVQALLRLRHVAGDRQLGLWLEDKALEICYNEKNPQEVWQRLCHLRYRMQRERTDEKPDSIDLKLGMGGLVDLEFLIQGNLLVKGYNSPLTRASSIRAAMREFLDDVPECSNRSKEIKTAFGAVRALDHRLRLHLNQSSAKISPEQFESLKAIGLWPPARGGTTIETWEDILKYRRIIRGALSAFCPNLPT